jgi:hypothetical protein
MKRSRKISLIIGGLLLGLAAFPVFGQDPVGPPAVVIDKQPLADFRSYVKDELAKKEVDLNAPFSLEMEGYLTKDGKLGLSRTKFVRTEGDKHILELVENGIEAVNDAGYLRYLLNMSGNTIHLSIVQDEANFSLTVRSELESTRRAKTLETIFKFYISSMIQKKQEAEAGENNKDEIELLRNLTAETEGKKMVFKFSAPKSFVQALIRKRAGLAQIK